MLYQRILIKQIRLRFKSFSLAVHISRKVNGSMRAIFSKHSVVSVTVPSASVFQIHQPPITSESGFIHILRLSKVLNRIITVKNSKWQIVRTLTKFQTAKRRSYFFSVFLHFSGRFGDHGSRSSQKLKSLSSICFGISSNRYSKYSYGFRWFAFAVSAILQIIALVWAPLIVSMITQFFRPIQKFLIALSAALLSNGTYSGSVVKTKI